jgi:hypothetical protein
MRPPLRYPDMPARRPGVTSCAQEKWRDKPAATSQRCAAADVETQSLAIEARFWPWARFWDKWDFASLFPKNISSALSINYN